MLSEAATRTSDSPGGDEARPAGSRSARLGRAIRHNWLFTVALLLSVIPRLISFLGYQPAVLFKLDTYDYLWNAVHLRPDPVNTSGYSLFLWLLKPLHSLAVVVALQHLLGLVVAVAMYAVLRRWNVRPWVATLATFVVLFAASEIFVEQLVMADFLALGLMLGSFVALLWQPRPSAKCSAWAGLMLALSVLVRPTTLPLVVIMALYLIIRRAGWRSVAAVLVATAVPVLAYMAWFASVSGSFNLTSSNGLFLWSRTMSFANCRVIQPPASLQPLCPNRQGLKNRPVGQRQPPKIYLWDHNAWLWRGKPQLVDGVRPDVAAFTPANNARGQKFAIDAIKAQPAAYLSVVGDQLIQPFVHQDTFLFELQQSHTGSMGPVNGRYATTAVREYDNSLAGIGPYLGHHLAARLVEPWARYVRGYQRITNLPPWVFGLIVLAGLAGLFWPRRRNWPAAMLWVSGAVALIVPIAEHDYTYRYALPTVPLFVMALVLCFGVAREQEGATTAASAAATLPGPGAGPGSAQPDASAAEPAESGGSRLSPDAPPASPASPGADGDAPAGRASSAPRSS